jgi:hypothetical protein
VRRVRKVRGMSRNGREEGRWRRRRVKEKQCSEVCYAA